MTYRSQQPAPHDHEGAYAAVDHGHTGYATDDHNHDADYAGADHDHDADYAAIGHSHDGGADFKPYCVRDTTGNQTIGTSPTTINLDAETVDDDTYSLANDTVTVPAGKYLVSYCVVYDITSTSGGTRGSVDAWIANGGTPIPQSYSRDYHREASGGSACQSTFVAVFEAEASLNLVADMNYSDTALDTVAGRSQVSLVKLA